jgi:isoleucyl-tRNA synthetase
MTYCYPSLPASIPQLEEEILAFWKKEKIFEESLNLNQDKNFIFYDGPPFANGLPHYGHLLTGFAKDFVGRYKTMQGYRVERKFGWDCHGLPAEMAAEKELGISGKLAIEAFGIDKFNNYCRSSVLKYRDQWEKYVERQGRWVDLQEDYKTMDLNYMETVIWVFKQLYDKGLIYKSSRVMPYSWACETPVSDFETKMDNSYRAKESKTATLAIKLLDSDLELLIWTTTPWTLPSNLALAVGKDLDYSIVSQDGRKFVIASSLLSSYKKELTGEVIGEIKGSALIGKKYQPLFDYFKDHPKAFQVIGADFVTTEDGTGLVHLAPGFGEEDQKACQEIGLELVCPVDTRGRFTQEVKDYQGLQVFEANDLIITRLKEEGRLIKRDLYQHNYPFCWRTDTPLIYKAVPSWYLKVTDLKEAMIKNNEKINWIPSHIKTGLFGKWLENARDWSISRNRYWGCPLPIWESTDPNYPHREVYGSLEELEKAFGVKITDLHLPEIDKLTKPNPSDPTGKSLLKRVSEVFDCWFESGSMPYAQLHYPFENKDYFEKNFPADFIVEYLAQTRGWFYTLLVLSTALFDKPPFLNAICHGVILGDGGQKMSKRLQNYPDPQEVFNKYGSDPLRWFMLSAPVMRGQELIIDKEGKAFEEAMRSVIKPIINAYNFFSLYANLDKVEAQFTSTSSNILDLYILSRVGLLASEVEKHLDKYDTIAACEAITKFLDQLNNWYIRRSRERFWRGTLDQDKKNAFDSLFSVLTLLCKIVAPLLPFISEALYLALNPNKKSVHLELYPKDLQYNLDLIDTMEKVREACTAALRIRNNAGIRVRQPLKSVTFIGLDSTGFSEELQELVLEEINVKQWINLDKTLIKNYGNFKLKLLLPILGKRIPDKVKEVINHVKAGLWEQNMIGELWVGEVKLEREEYELQLEPKENFINNSASSGDALVLLDLTLDRDLELEGLARDLLRFVQEARKSSGLEVSDRIIITFYSNNALLQESLNLWGNVIKEGALALEIVVQPWSDQSPGESLNLDTNTTLVIQKAS